MRMTVWNCASLVLFPAPKDFFVSLETIDTKKCRRKKSGNRTLRAVFRDEFKCEFKGLGIHLVGVVLVAFDSGWYGEGGKQSHLGK